MTRSHLFTSAPDQPRARRAGDFVLLVVGFVVGGIGAFLASKHLSIDETLGNAITNFPSWAIEVFEIGFALSALFVIWIVVMAVIRRRFDIVGYAALAIGFALVVAYVAALLAGSQWPIVLPEFGSATPNPHFPVIRVAVVTAVVFTVGLHVSRPVRWLGWISVVIVSISGIGLGLGLPTSALVGVGIGIVAAGSVLLIFGSPAGYPLIEDMRSQLQGLGVDVRDIVAAPVQTWGARTFAGTDASGRSLVIKVYGTDARDAQILTRMWRYVWYRDIGPSAPWSRLQQVEHEALVSVMAGRSGIVCPAVIVAATSENGDALLVTESLGTSLADLDEAEITDDVLVRTWSDIRTLHTARISHGSLDTVRVGLDGDRPVITNFQSGSLAASDARIAIDNVEFLVSTALLVGVERAVAVARSGLGDEALKATVPYLQLPALSSTTRRSIDKPGKFIKSLRTAVVDALQMEKPDTARLRRIRPSDIIFLVLILFMAGLILRQVAGVDFAEVWQTIQTANWELVLVALVVAQLVLFPYAVSLMSVVRVAIPLRATIVLQSAIQFIGIAVPSSAGRIATNIAYLRKFGLSPTAAVTQGAVDSFSMFIVQMVILVVAFAFGDVNFGFGNSGSSGGADWGLVLGIAAAVVGVGIVVVLSVSKLRKQVLKILGDARDALSVLVEEPKRAVVLFSSNVAAQLILGVTMWIAVVSIGQRVSLGAALAVVVGAVLLGGLAPTPGGVGVQEAVLAAGLVGVGLSSSDATAAAIIYRVVTFMLPPVWGAVSLGWLRKNDYI
jgi:uncharacterized membrane protein YbhN (UPF0104 family)